ncbi:MAG TPA: amidohydrolase family protein [Candidatus Acidoferrum sp.]|nr:amidohydrolase family protein [Candidatus Acidoferrum sp.]
MKCGSVGPRFGMIVLAIICVSLPGARELQGQGGEPRSFAISGAKVVPVSGPVLEAATVVVSHGLIVAVGKEVTIPADAWVIEGKGLTVYPGFIDAFTDVGIAAAQSDSEGKGKQPPLSKGPEDRPSTTPWRNAADELNINDPRIETWRSAGFTTTVSAPKGGIFPGQAAVLDLAGERPGNFVVKEPTAIPVSLEAPGGFRSYPGSLMGAIAYVRQVGIDTNWSTQAAAAYEISPRGMERPRYDRTEATLTDAFGKHEVVLLPGNTSLQIRRALRLAAEWKWNAVIYGCQMGYEVAPELAAKKTAVLVDLKWPEADKDGDPEAETSLRTLRFRDRAPSSPAALQKAGVKFAFYSGGITTPKDLLPAVKKSIDAGLAPDAALRALTLSPAEIYGIAERLGSIEKGKIANLVVTDGDIFDKKTKVKIVFVDGRKFEVREPQRPSDPPKGDLTGKWKLTYTTPEGQEESTADLLMASDGTLTGTLTNQRGTGTIFSGYLSGDKFSFTINIPIEGSPQDVHFNGTFDGTTLKGTIGTMGYSFDFTGTKPGTAATLSGGAK